MIEASTQRNYARVAGLFYLLVLAFDIAGLVITSSIEGSGGFAGIARNVAASETLYRIGLSLALLGSLCTIPLAVGLYVTLRPADTGLATLGLVFRSAEATIGGIGVFGSFAVLQAYLSGSQQAFDAQPLGGASQIAAIFFCVGSTIFFWAFLKSGYLPRMLSVWGVFASVVYLTYWLASLIAPDLPGAVTIAASLPILVAEVTTGLWLLIKGAEPVSSPSRPPLAAGSPR
jgi:hypothetical protein